MIIRNPPVDGNGNNVSLEGHGLRKARLMDSNKNEELRSALQEALIAMKLASALPGVADEYDFEPAIRSAVRALATDKTSQK